MYISEPSHKAIEELERAWASLGPLRCISFNCRFEDPATYEGADSEQNAKEVAAYARDNGFDVDIRSDGRRWEVKSSKHILPTEETVTYWAKQFQKLMGSSGYYDGWSYPFRAVVSFSLHNPKGHAGAANLRSEVLFGKTLAYDPLKKTSEANFEIVPSKFVQLAKNRSPDNPEPTASGFAQWIYSLYANARGDELDRARGKKIEEHVWSLARSAAASANDRLLREKFPQWTLLHNGMEIDRGSPPKFFEVPTLKVRGVPLRTSPDLVYQHAQSREILIVEIKNSYQILPVNLWPNVWGQLWCYSKMGEFSQSAKVTAVAEVWAAHTSGRDRVEKVSLRSSVRRDPRASAFNRFYQTLFDIYSGAEDR